MKLTHRFVVFLPEELEDGVLYVSIPYAVVEHRCCSGCGERVTTPLSPTDWSLTFDGKTVSLQPSIGNWNFPCQSHYWIRKNEVIWAPHLSRNQIEDGRARDRASKAAYYGERREVAVNRDAPQMRSGLWKRVKHWLLRRRHGRD